MKTPDHHAAVMDALHRYETAWAAYEWHFRHNNDPNRKEQSAMVQMCQAWEELTALGVVAKDNGEIDYPLSKADLAALSETRRMEREHWQGQALAPVIAEEYQERLAAGQSEEGATRYLSHSVYEQAHKGHLQLPPEQAHAFAAKWVRRVIESVASPSARLQAQEAAE